MNRYILSSFIAFILVSMGLSSLIVGATNYIQNKKSESGKMMFSLLLSVFLWDFGYAWMSLCFDSDFAYVPRAIALLGTVFYQFFLVKYISSLVNFSERNFTPFYVIFVVASLIVWTQIIGKSAVTFQSTPWGYWYTTHMSPFRVCQFILAISSTFIFYYIVLTKLRKNKLSRLKEILKGYLWFAPIVFTGYFIDTFVPAFFKVPAVPASAVGAFFSTMLLFRLSKKYKAFGISKDNISEFVFQDVNIPVIITDYENNIALINGIVPEFFGYSESELINRNFEEFISEITNDSIDENSEDYDNENMKKEDVIRICVKDNTKHEIKFADTVVNDKFDELMYTIHFVQDLTREHEIMNKIEESRKQAEDANMAKSNFLANMSHEIRTPMNAIIGMSEIILQNNKDLSVADDVRQIKVAADNLLGIINDILDISKIEAGKYEIIDDEYEVASLFNDVSTIIRVRLQETKTKYVLEIEDDIPALVVGDQVRVRQILLNILGNAVKFTKEGSVTLKVGWNKDKENPLIKFDVIDTGIGIKEEDIDNIFGAFTQVDTRKNRAIQGTGLGLAISRELARKMGGDIVVTSDYGKGSTFSITVKQGINKYVQLERNVIEALSNAQYHIMPKKEETEEIKKTGAKVLVVDDIEINLIIAEGLLKKYDVEVDLASSGKKAIEMVKEKEYDLIFMDHMMPEMDGIDATRHIRELPGEHNKNVTIVALTANALNESKELMLESGMQDFIPKPIEPKRLDEIIRKWL